MAAWIDSRPACPRPVTAGAPPDGAECLRVGFSGPCWGCLRLRPACGHLRRCACSPLPPAGGRAAAVGLAAVASRRRGEKRRGYVVHEALL